MCFVAEHRCVLLILRQKMIKHLDTDSMKDQIKWENVEF